MAKGPSPVSRFWALLLALTLFLLSSVVCADANLNTTLDTPSLPVSSTPRGLVRTDVGSIISLIVLVIIGLAYCFYGFSLFNPTLFLTGFLLAANITLMALDKSGAFSTSGYSPTAVRLIFLAIAFGAGFIGGWLLVCCWSVGVYVIGLLGGYIAANLLISAIPSQLALAVRIIIIVLFCVAGVVLIHFFEKAIIITATSVTGAYVTVLGIDMVVNRGIAYDLQHNEPPTADSLYEVVAALGLAFIGIIVQYVKNRNVSFGGHVRQPQPGYAQSPYGKYP